MVLAMMENGKMIKNMVEECINMLMETNMMVNGKMVNHMVKEYIDMQMEKNMKGIG